MRKQELTAPEFEQSEPLRISVQDFLSVSEAESLPGDIDEDRLNEILNRLYEGPLVEFEEQPT
jgi:hypothetical protein